MIDQTNELMHSHELTHTNSRLRLGPGSTVVTILCDGGWSYLPKGYDSRWLEEKSIALSRTEARDFVDSFDESRVKICM